MIYAYDRSMQMPTKDLYDTQMMAMAVSAAKDMYEKGLKALEDFNKTYGDFYSPILADMERYNQLVTNPILSAIEDLYSNGIDPLRSAEGRAYIQRLINRVPISKVNLLKLSAAAAEEYIKNRGILDSKGLYNSDFENNFLGYDLSKWDTISNGVWNRTSPSEFKTLKDLTNDWYDKRTAHELTKSEVESFGPDYKYDPRYKYTGFTDADALAIAADRTPGWQGSPYAAYYRLQAENKLKRSGIDNPTSEQIEAQLQRDIATANREYLIKPVSDVDKYKYAAFLSNLDYQNAIRLLNAKDNGGNGRGGKKTESGIYSYLAHALNAAVNSDKRTFTDRQRAHLKLLLKKNNGVLNTQELVDALTISDGSGAILQYYLNRPVNDGGTITYIPQQDNSRLLTAGELAFNMLGIGIHLNDIDKFKKRGKSLRSQISTPYRGNTNTNEDPIYSSIIPTGKSVFFTDKSGTIRHYIEVEAQYGGGKKQKMYMDSGAQYDANYIPTGNMASAIAADQRVSQMIANKSNKTQSLIDPTDYE